MNLVLLHGPAAAGKLTVARALAAHVGYPVFHNHLTVDLLTTVFPFGSQPFARLREAVWLAVLTEAARPRRQDRQAGADRRGARPAAVGDAGPVTEFNVAGDRLQPCGTDPMTGFFRDGCCSTGPEDLGSHTICAVVTAEFLDHQRSIGNDLTTPMPQYRFPGLQPGDRWCVTAVNWVRAYNDGAAAPVVLASTNEAVLDIVPLAVLREHAIDVPADPSSLEL